MAEYALFIDRGVPYIYRELYDILLNAIESTEFPFKQHSLCFRCRRCEDVIELRIKDIRLIYFYQDYMRIDFDESSVWLSPYDNVEDIWIEKLMYEDEQMTLLDDFKK